MNRSPALLMGVPIADLTMSETLDRVGQLIQDGRERDRTHQISTINVDFLANTLADPDLLKIFQSADLSIADGMPIVWVAGLLDMKLRERVAGADLVPEIIGRSQREGWRVHMFGSTPDVATRARELVARRWPDAAVTIDPGPMIPDVSAVDPACIESIANTRADVLCVALGNPKQEHFIHTHREALGIPVMIGVGGALDMLVGERWRAPDWMQRTGLEWVARAAQEPRRLGMRYARDIRVMAPEILTAWRAHRRNRGGANVELSIRAGIDVSLRQVDGLRPEDYSDAVDSLLDGAQLVLRANGATTVTDAAAAAVIGLVTTARAAGSPMIWREPPGPELLAALERLDVTPAMWGLDRDLRHP